MRTRSDRRGQAEAHQAATVHTGLRCTRTTPGVIGMASAMFADAVQVTQEIALGSGRRRARTSDRIELQEAMEEQEHILIIHGCKRLLVHVHAWAHAVDPNHDPQKKRSLSRGWLQSYLVASLVGFLFVWFV